MKFNNQEFQGQFNFRNRYLSPTRISITLSQSCTNSLAWAHCPILPAHRHTLSLTSRIHFSVTLITLCQFSLHTVQAVWESVWKSVGSGLFFCLAFIKTYINNNKSLARGTFSILWTLSLRITLFLLVLILTAPRSHFSLPSVNCQDGP